MAVLTSEVIEFKSTGGDSLVQQYEKLQAESLKLKVQTGQLQQQLKDGTFLKQANDIQKATAAVGKLREEQRKLWDDSRRQVMQQRYGQTLGGGLYAAQKYGGRAAEVGRALGGGALATVAGFAAPLGVAALANRGFSGTSHAANLDNEFTRLSRHVASDLIPAMDLLTKFVNRINRASDRIRAGNGGLLDHAEANIPYTLAAAGIAAAAARTSLGKQAFAAAGRAGFSALEGAGFAVGTRAVSNTPFGLNGAKINPGSTLAQEAAAGAGGGVAARFGGVAKVGAWGLAAYSVYDSTEKLTESRPQDKGLPRYKSLRNRAFDFAEDTPAGIPLWAMRQVGLDPRSKKGADAVAVTAETGQKVGMTDSYEELQNKFGQLTNEKGEKGYEKKAQEENTAALKDVADHLRAFRNKMGI